MDTPLTEEPRMSDALMQKLLSAARFAEAVAQRSRTMVKALFVLGMLSAVWVTYYFAAAFHLSQLSSVALFVILAVPPMLLGKLSATLQQTIGLPQRLSDFTDIIEGRVVGLRARVQAHMPSDVPKRPPRIADLWRVGKAIREVRSFASEVQELSVVLGGALALTNPVFVVVMAIAGAISIMVSLVALSTAIMALF